MAKQLEGIQGVKGFPGSSAGKESACNADSWIRFLGSIPGSGRSAEEGRGYPLQYSWASLVAQLVKNLPTMQETCVQFLGWEDPLEKGKATYPLQYSDLEYFPILHGLIESCLKESDRTERLSLLTSLYSYSPVLFLTIASKIMFSYPFSQAS